MTRRVVAGAGTSALRRWAWLLPAAAAAMACVLYVLAASARRDLAAQLTMSDPQRDMIVRALTADLGGNEEAGWMAARLIEINEATPAAIVDPGSRLDVDGHRHD